MGKEKMMATITDYKSTFGSEHGKRVLWDMMKASGYTASNFDSKNPHNTSYNERMRAVVLRIMNLIKMDVKQVEAFIRKQTESEALYGGDSGDII